jgi:hypothetical protein
MNYWAQTGLIKLFKDYAKYRRRFQKVLDTKDCSVPLNIREFSAHQRRLSRLQLLCQKVSSLIPRRVLLVSVTLVFGVLSPLQAQIVFNNNPSKNPLKAQVKGQAGAVPTFADMDGDGDLDLILSDFSCPEGCYGRRPVYYENTGTASQPEFSRAFDSADPFQGFSYANQLMHPHLVDMDSDGDLDMLYEGSSGQVDLLYNQGSPTNMDFSAQAVPFSALSVPPGSKFTFADIDNDGDLDVFFSPYASSYFGMLINTGTQANPAFENGTNPFTSFTDISNNSRPIFVDIDNDGDLDVLFSEAFPDPYAEPYSYTYANRIRFLENTGTAEVPTFEEKPAAENVFSQLQLMNTFDFQFPSELSLADLDNDGDLDLVVGNFDRNSPNGGTLDFFENIGTAEVPLFLTQSKSSEIFGIFNTVGPMQSAQPVARDVDQDGYLDILVKEDMTLKFFKGQPGGGYALASGTSNPFESIYVSGGSGGVTLVDIDGDGDLDLITPGSGGLTLYVNYGGFFQADSSGVFSSISAMPPLYPEFADIDGDGDLDMILVSGMGVLYYQNLSVENTGNAQSPNFMLVSQGGPFQSANLPNPMQNDMSIRFADVDGDGDLDFVISERQSMGVIRFWENTGTPQVANFVELTGVANPFAGLAVGDYFPQIEFADLDSDGDPDLLVGASRYNMFGETRWFVFAENSTNRAPWVSEGINEVILEQGMTVNDDIIRNFSDSNNDILTYTQTGLPAGLSLDPQSGLVSGTLTNADALSSPYNVIFKATDPFGLSAQITFPMIVNNVNDAPVSMGILADTLFTQLNADFSFDLASLVNDPDLDELTYTFSPVSALGLNFDPGTGLISGAPSAVGSIPVTVTIEDPQGATLELAFVIQVNPLNNPPVILNPVPATTLQINQVLNINFANYVDDPDLPLNDQLFFEIYDLPEGLSLDMQGGKLSGAITDPALIGEYQLVVYVFDTQGAGVELPWNLSVVAVNSPPELLFSLPSTTLNLNEPLNLNLSEYVSDPDLVTGDQLSYELTNLPEGLVANPLTGVISGQVSNSAFVGGYEIPILIFDTRGATLELTWNLLITDSNGPPDEHPVLNVPEIIEVPPGSVQQNIPIIFNTPYQASELLIEFESTDESVVRASNIKLVAGVQANTLSMQFTPESGVQTGDQTTLRVILRDPGTGEIISEQELLFVVSDFGGTDPVLNLPQGSLFATNLKGQALRVSVRTPPAELDPAFVYKLSLEGPGSPLKDGAYISLSVADTDFYPLLPGDYKVRLDVYSYPQSRIIRSDSARVLVNGVFAHNLKPQTWQMLGFGSDPFSFDRFVSGTEIFHWNENRNSDPIFDKYMAGRQLNTASPGLGYWYSSAVTQDFEILAQDSSLRSFNYRLNTADQGWNQISSPFNFPVSAEYFEPLDLFQWDSDLQDYIRPTVILPGVGYWAHARTQNSLTVRPEPHFGQIPKLGRRVQSSFESIGEWQVMVSLESGTMGDRQNVIGVSSKTGNIAEPPRGFGEWIALELVDDGKSLSQDIRAEMGDGQTFKMLLKASRPETANLKFFGLEAVLNAGYQVFLSDESSTIPIRDAQPILVELSESSSEKFLTILPKESNAQKWFSEKFLQIKANNGLWEINYSLIQSTNQVVFEVLDSRGKIIRMLKGSGTPGLHSINWNGLDENQQHPGSGILFLRMRTANQIVAKPFLFKL